MGLQGKLRLYLARRPVPGPGGGVTFASMRIGGTQEAMLSNYVGNNKPMAELTADDVAQLKLLLVQ